MKFLKKIHLNFYVLYLCLVFVALVGVYSVNAADSDKRLIGYSWSSNIGWVSFNNGNVFIDATGNLSGYAWSSNIGWVKFGGLSGFPDASLGGNAKIDGNNLTGWARVVSVTNPITFKTIDNRGGWDGWISLNSNGKSPAYGVTLDDSTNKFKGFAWGSDVLGWLDWSLAKVSATDVLCTSANGLLEDGEKTTIGSKLTSGPDEGKCQTQQYICKGTTLETVGEPSTPEICNFDCEARDGIVLKDGESHLFYRDRVVSGTACVSANITCTGGELVGADGLADDLYMYARCLNVPSYEEAQ